jgi:hypothetical protein
LEGKGILIPPAEMVWWLPFLLYAETHYRFKYFFSLLRKREPEIIADTPHRLEPGHPLPLLVLAKDANFYPCTLRQVKVLVKQGSRILYESELLSTPRSLDKPLWCEIFRIDASGWSGWIDVEVAMQVQQRGRIRTYHSDNHRTSSHDPLRVYVAKDALPRFPGLVLGDAHTHSSYTSDQVEFGPPLRAARELCQAMGLSFFCVTDHSYDLDDKVDTYLVNDPDLSKWKALQAEVGSANAETDSFAIVRGEEVTCRNGRDKNVHLLLLGSRAYIPGSGDGAERWLRTRSEHSIDEVLALKEQSAVAFAAHPQEGVPVLQRLLLSRGSWLDRDLQAQGLNGIQFANGFLDKGFRAGKESWIRLLLSGRHVIALGGNDAHGNFNRFRQVGFPFLKIKEMDHQLFGGMRTGVIVEGKVSEEAILHGLRNGSVIVSDGPVARISLREPTGATAGLGGAAKGKSQKLSLDARSSAEFGELARVNVLVGEIGTAEEKLVDKAEGNLGFDVTRDIALEVLKPSYVRVELFTIRQSLSKAQPHWCITNPIWIEP